MTSNHTVYVYSVYSSVPQYYLTVTGNGHGSQNVASGWFTNGTTVTILNTPSINYYFGNSQVDGVNGSANPVSVIMTANHTVSFYDYLLKYYLTINTDGNEAVNQTSAWFTNGTNVGVRATPNLNYQFTNFTVDGNLVASNPMTVLMTSNHTVYAYSSLIRYYLTINAPANGAINQTSGWFTNGTAVGLLATPNSNYTFLNWRIDGANSTSNPTSVRMMANHTISAYFNLQQSSNSTQYSYTIYTDGSGNYFAKNGTTGQIVYSGTDAASVFNSAISGLPSGGGSIFVDSGIYSITSTINLRLSNTVLCGAGASTVLNVPMTNDFGILVTGAITNATIENLKFVGPGTGYTGDTACLVMVSWTNYVTIQDCYFYGCGSHSIFIVESDYALVTRNYVSGSALDGIGLAQGADYCTVSNNFVTNTSNMHDMNGIDINGKVKASTHNTIIDNTIQWSHGGICFDTACNNIAQGNTISHVILGIDNTGAGGSTATTDNQLIGNTISYSEGANFGLAGYNAGIQISHLADRTTVTGNIISNFADRCILLNSNGNTITGNTFKDSPVGMAVGSGLTGNVLAPNTYINVPAGNYN
jgi:parallel beta-helix repeat protein